VITITKYGKYWLVSAGGKPIVTFATLSAALAFVEDFGYVKAA
jgi:hypothetical protein